MTREEQAILDSYAKQIHVIVVYTSHLKMVQYLVAREDLSLQLADVLA